MITQLDFHMEYEKSVMAEAIKTDFAQYHPSDEEKHVMTQLGELDKYATSYLKQSVILFLRNTISNIRNPSSSSTPLALLFAAADCTVIWVRLFQSILMALLVGSIFWQVPNDTDGIQSRMSALFFTTSFLVMSSFASLPLRKFSSRCCSSAADEQYGLQSLRSVGVSTERSSQTCTVHGPTSARYSAACYLSSCCLQ